MIKKLINNFIRRKKRINPARRIAAGFIIIILAGAFLLSLPFSSRSGEATPFIESLFTSVSATCVTGLVIYDTYQHWSFFGQLVLLALIQTGGLGFMSIIIFFYLMSRREIGLRDRMLLRQGMGFDNMSGIVRIMRHVLTATFVIEGAGAVILGIRFCFMDGMGIAEGIWHGIFHSVSAFCNAGFDLNGRFAENSSMMTMNSDPIVLITLSLLIIIGGIGFFVWEEIYNLRSRRRLSVYSSLVLCITAILVAGGTAALFFAEGSNAETVGNMPFWQKLLNMYFQSVTTRTAGFDSIGQAAMTDKGKIISSVLMIIGGSSGSTAGGVKTVSAGIAVIAAFKIIVTGGDIVVFGRRISHRQIITAYAVIMLALIIDITGSMIISSVYGLNFLNCWYETVSAYATVGLSAGITAQTGTAAWIILMLCMYTGRIGIITVAVTLMLRTPNKNIRYPSANIFIG